MARASYAKFEAYVSSVEADAVRILRGQLPEGTTHALELVDGNASLVLRQTVPLDERRTSGAFFSSSEIRRLAAEPFPPSPGATLAVLDPAVGGGDLLIGYASGLPADGPLDEVLAFWGERLNGRDVQPLFVRLARARLVLFAWVTGARAVRRPLAELDKQFPGIKVGDGLLALEAGGWDQVVMNPPFTYTRLAAPTPWAAGRINLAAVFLAKALSGGAPGATLSAVLPDVIRSGSRYSKLRALAASCLQQLTFQSLGRFDPWTDVDVVLMSGVFGTEDAPTGAHQNSQFPPTIGDRFRVKVGSVVPHRSLEDGASRPYISARRLPATGTFDVRDAQRRSFAARPFAPPFVAVRRTSRPIDKARLRPVVVVGDAEVLVENHLLVLQPHDATEASCYELARLLSSRAAVDRLNARIRCRHITVTALAEIPWIEE